MGPRGRRAADVAAPSVAALAFALYAYCHQTGIGGFDEWGYYSQALSLLGVDPVPTAGFDPARFPALAPLAWNVVGHRLVPFQPPGFPLLLALGDVFGAALLVTPALGAISVWLVYRTTRRDAGPLGALLLAAVWGALPIVSDMSTRVMSDMPAAVCTLGAWLLLDLDRPAWSGAVTGFSLLVRPSNVAFALVMAVLRVRGRARVRFVLPVALGGVVLAAVWWERFGPPGSWAYATNVRGIGPPSSSQLAFLLCETARTTWAILPLVLLGIVRDVRRALVLLAWFAAVALPYAGWPVPFIAWWWVRYLLPALPALVILAGFGLRDLFFVSKRLASFAVVGLGLAVPIALYQSTQLDALVLNPSSGYLVDAKRVADATPADALVGCTDLAGAVRLYAHRITFQAYAPTTAALVRTALARGRPVFFADEPPLFGEVAFAPAWHKFRLQPVTDLAYKPGTRLWQVVAR